MFNEILPFSLYFIIIIFFLAGIKHSRFNNHKNSLNLSTNKIENFLIDSEKKLKALKDLYLQGLISQRIYIEKTDQIAKIVNNVMSNDFYEFAKKKNNEIIKELKNEIQRKIDKFDSDKKKDVNIDNLLDSIDNKLDKNQN